jgi:hypothetical protein
MNPAITQEIQAALDLDCNTADDVLKMNDMLSNAYNSIYKNLGVSTGEKNMPNQRKPRKSKLRPKNKWFDKDCIMAKRELNRLAKLYGKNPTNENIRKTYYVNKKAYRKLI